METTGRVCGLRTSLEHGRRQVASLPIQSWQELRLVNLRTLSLGTRRYISCAELDVDIGITGLDPLVELEWLDAGQLRFKIGPCRFQVNGLQEMTDIAGKSSDPLVRQELGEHEHDLAQNTRLVALILSSLNDGTLKLADTLSIE